MKVLLKIFSLGVVSLLLVFGLLTTVSIAQAQGVPCSDGTTASSLAGCPGPNNAGITNPVIGQLGASPTQAKSGSTFLTYFVTIWRAMISLGGLVVIFYFVWAGLEWIYAGGDSAKIQKARDKMTQGIIGLILLVGSFVIIGFLGTLFFGDQFDILKLTIPTPTT